MKVKSVLPLSARKTRRQSRKVEQEETESKIDATEAVDIQSLSTDQLTTLIESILSKRLISTSSASQVTPSAPSSLPTSSGYEPKALGETTTLERTLKPPRLTSSVNFTDWALQFKSVLNVDELDKFLDPSVAFDTNDKFIRKKLALVRATLIASVDSSFIEVIRSSDDGLSPAPIWRALHNNFSNTSSFNLQNLSRQLFSLKMDDSTSLITFIDTLNQLSMKLKEGGTEYNITDKMKVTIFTNGLHGRYREHVNIIHAMQYNYEVSCSTTVDYHRRLFGNPTSTAGLEDRALQATHPKGKGGRSDQKQEAAAPAKRKKAKCPKCKKFAYHRAAECKGHIKCDNCSNTGHSTAECRKNTTANLASEDSAWMTSQDIVNATVTLPTGAMVVDSGCSATLVNSTEGLTDFVRDNNIPPIQQAGGDNSPKLKVIGTGVLHPWGRVKVVPDLACSLLSTRQLHDEKGWTTTLSDTVEIRSASGELIASGQLHSSGMYIITNVNTTVANAAVASPSLLAAHYKYGHLSLSGLSSLHRLGLLQDVSEQDLKRGLGTCAACATSKSTHQPHPKKSLRRATRKLELIHVDICGPMSVATVDGARYFQLIVDDATRMIYPFLLKTKDEALSTLIKFQEEIANPEGLRIGTIRHDGGGEFTSGAMSKWCTANGIQREITGRYSPEQNGVVERANRTIIEMANTTMKHAGLETTWWGPAVLHAAYTRNRCPTAALDGELPYTAWHGLRPNTDLLKPFGVTGYIEVPDTLRSKFDTKAIRGMFIGIDRGRKSYKMYIPSTKSIVTSRNVIFETDAASTRNVFELPAEGSSMPTPPSHKQTRAAGVEINGDNAEPAAADEKIVIIPRALYPHDVSKLKAKQLREQLQLRKQPAGGSKRELASRLRDILKMEQSQPPPAQEQKAAPEPTPADNEAKVSSPEGGNSAEAELTNIALFCTGYALLAQTAGELARTVPVPTNHAEAMHSPDSSSWQQAIDAELNSLAENNVFDIVPRPNDQPVLGSRWTFRVKERADGTIDKYKARFVVKGFLQEYGVNYRDTYAPVTRAVSIRVILALAASRKWPVEQMDVTTAFLYGHLQEEVYIEPPEGSTYEGDKVWKLNRALYGLKQAPRAWNQQLTEFMISIGLRQSVSDPCIFLSYGDDSQLDCAVAIYVDDIIITAALIILRNKVKKALAARYKMTDMGLLSWYLGMKITQQPSVITLSQESYIEATLEKFGMAECKSASTPMLEGSQQQESKSDELDTEGAKQYRSLLGCLMYISICTRPDISFAVNRLARFVSHPTAELWTAAKRILRYLQGTSDYGLAFKGESTSETPTLIGFSDASWADQDANRCSTTGILFQLGQCTIAWSSYVQKGVATSSTEAEYCALSDTVKEATWIQRLLTELGAAQPPTVIYQDNQGTIASVLSESSSMGRLKHVDTRYHNARAKVLEGTISLNYLPTADMIADVLTKPLGPTKHSKFRAKMGVVHLQ